MCVCVCVCQEECVGVWVRGCVGACGGVGVWGCVRAYLKAVVVGQAKAAGFGAIVVVGYPAH